MQIEQLNAQLQREQLERSMAEGALESGRKDIARLMREIARLQHRPVAASRPSELPQRSRESLRQRGLSFSIRQLQHRRRRGKPGGGFLSRLPHQLPHRAVQSIQRQRIHPAAHQLRIMRIEWVCSHWLSGTGLSQTQAG